MAPTRIITGVVLLGALAGVPAFADDGQRQRGDRRGERTHERRAGREGSRAVPRAPQAVRSYDRQRRYQERRYDDRRRVYARPYTDRGSYDRGRVYARPYGDRRFYDRGRVYARPYGDRGFYDRRRVYARPYADRRLHGRRTVIVRPRILTIAPYRPFHYRPSIGLGVYYGAGGSYPYGYTPRGYYDPIPGHVYGGVRITDAPRDAQVFADGYYVGIVDDFDGVFQHVNLEAGEHRIEIREPGLEPIAFDIIVQPGRTITLRVDPY